MLKAWRPKLNPAVTVYWLISLVAAVVMWHFLPSHWAQAGLVLLLIMIALASMFHYMELPLIASVFFVILLVNDWLVTKHIAPIYGSAILCLALPLIGLASEIIGYNELQIRRSYWALLGLLVAEVNSLFYYWPVSFFNRTLLTGVVFYSLWQLLRLNSDQSNKSYLAHFAFILLTVILVVGLIVWSNFPQLVTY